MCAHSGTQHSLSQLFPGALSHGFNSQCPSAKSIILKTSNCITITIDILDMGHDMQTARTQHLISLFSLYLPDKTNNFPVNLPEIVEHQHQG